MSIPRRRFLQGAVGAAATAAASSLAAPALALTPPLVGLTCAHTGRSCQMRFDGTMSRDEVTAFRSVTQDWREHQLYDMDLKLVPLLSGIQKKVGSERLFLLLSGYRTPKTNRMLSGTAKHSLHMRGQALDIRHDDLSTRELRDLAVRLHAGGVGYYPQAHNLFVHVDTGPIRYW